MRTFANSPPAASDTNWPPRPKPLLDPTPPDSVVVLDERGRIQHFDPSAEHLFGYREAEVLGCGCAILMPSFHRRPFGPEGLAGRERLDRDHFDDVTIEPRLEDAQYILIGQRSDLGKFPLHLTIREVCLPGERLFTGAIRDLTLCMERDRLRRMLQTELAWVACAGQLGHLASKVVRGAIQPL